MPPTARYFKRSTSFRVRSDWSLKKGRNYWGELRVRSLRVVASWGSSSYYSDTRREVLPSMNCRIMSSYYLVTSMTCLSVLAFPYAPLSLLKLW